MNNEEKILAMLEQLQQGQIETVAWLDKVDSRLDKVDARLDNMQDDITGMKGDIGTLKSDMSDVKGRVVKIELRQENIVDKSIKLLVEGHGDIVKKLRGLDDLTERVEDIQHTVDVLKDITVKEK